MPFKGPAPFDAGTAVAFIVGSCVEYHYYEFIIAVLIPAMHGEAAAGAHRERRYE